MEVNVEMPCDINQYVERFLVFLGQYEWVYNFKAIDILHGNIQKMPVTFQDAFNLMLEKDFQSVLEHHNQDYWSAELKSFVNYCLLLKCTESSSLGDVGIGSGCSLGLDSSLSQPCSSEIPEKWSLKKYAEVTSLSKFVGRNYRKFNCDKALDIGSGLGYLSITLSESFGASVIAIEGERKRVISAQKLVQGQSQKGDGDVKFINMKLDNDIVNQISPLISPYSRVCITGLHACGELSNITLKLFISSCNYSYLSIVPCCYHKMDLNSFENFPLSKAFRASFSENSVENRRLLGYQFCRLASQRCGAEFLRNVVEDTKQLFFRSILECYVNREGFRLSKTKRRVRSVDTYDFSQYVKDNVLSEGGYKIISEVNIDVEQHYKNLLDVHDEMKVWWKPITGILALQGALQTLAEQFILLDKVQFLLETPGVSEVKLKRIISESVSPRGIVVYAVKESVSHRVGELMIIILPKLRWHIL